MSRHTNPTVLRQTLRSLERFHVIPGSSLMSLPRCPSLNLFMGDEYRCELDEGHSGYHYNYAEGTYITSWETGHVVRDGKVIES